MNLPMLRTFTKTGLAPSAKDSATVRAARRRRGVSVTEFAVISPVLFLVLLGIMEIGRGLMVVHLLNDASMAGCRVGIIEGKSTANIKSVVVAALTSTGVSGDTVTVQVNDGSSDASSAGVGDEITVIAQVPISSISWVPGAKYLKGSLQGQYTMRRE
jgi:Flp pilus assembly protein TadG